MLELVVDEPRPVRVDVRTAAVVEKVVSAVRQRGTPRLVAALAGALERARRRHDRSWTVLLACAMWAARRGWTNASPSWTSSTST
jgi:hypothetical protein